MRFSDWFVLVFFAYCAHGVIVRVGMDRDPITPRLAARSMVVYMLVVLVVLAGAGV